MGRNKALLHAGGVPLIRRVADALSIVADRMVVIANEPEDYGFLGLPIIKDRVMGAGPLGGIYTALKAAGSDLCFVLACDLPLMRPGMLKILEQNAPGYDATVPRTSREDHPLSAVYATTGLRSAEAQIEKGDYKVTRFLDRIRTRWVGPQEWGKADPEGRSFLNVNTPEDYCRILEFVACGKRERDDGFGS